MKKIFSLTLIIGSISATVLAQDATIGNQQPVVAQTSTVTPARTQGETYFLFTDHSSYQECNCSSKDSLTVKKIATIMNNIDTLLKVDRKKLSQNSSQATTINNVKKQIASLKSTTIDTAALMKTIDESSSKTKESINDISKLQNDSTEFSGMIKGAQNRQINIALYQHFPNVFDDYPKALTQIDFGISMPLNKKNGKVSCSTWTPIFFRNAYLDIIATTSSIKGFGPQIDTISKRAYLNLLDLYQYSYFSIKLNINLFTFIITPQGSPNPDHIYWYTDALIGVAGSNVFFNSKDSLSSNFEIYGLNSTVAWAIRNFPIIPVFNAQLFWIDPNSNSFSPNLNSQYNKLNSDVGSTLTYSNPERYAYASFNFTMKYSLPTTSGSGNPSGNKSSSVSTTPTILYAHFGYFTNITPFNNANGRYHNNYYILQAGTSLDIGTVANTVKTLLGGSSGSTSSTKSTN